MRKLYSALVCAALCAGLLAGCSSGSQPGSAAVHRNKIKSEELQFTAPQKGDTIAVFDTSMGEMKAVLYPQYAPMAVENFIGLAEMGYYDGTIIWRAEEGFVVQGGDASGTGTGGTTLWNGNGYPAEYSEALHHYAGALCMAVDQSDAVGRCFSSFYVVTALPDSVDEAAQTAMTELGWRAEIADAYRQAGGLPYLDNTDTVFGQMYEGLSVADAMAAAQVDEAMRPVEDIVIHSITIETVK